MTLVSASVTASGSTMAPSVGDGVGCPVVLPFLVLLFIVVPIAELAVIIQVGQEIGVGPTVLILVADSILGSLLLRAQGRKTWQRFTHALRAGRPPAREVIDGALVLVGGALLLTPGFVTDVLGIAQIGRAHV